MLPTLQDALTALQQGDKQRATRILASIVQSQPHHEAAWLMLASVLDDPAQKRHCLQRALALNPHNERARQALAALGQPAPQAPQSAVSQPQLTSAESESVSVPQSVEQSDGSSWKKCPYCAEIIRRDAVICRFCGRTLATGQPVPGDPTMSLTTRGSGDTLSTFIIVLLIILGLFWIAVGTLQIAAGLAGFTLGPTGTGTLVALCGLWNFGISVVNLLAISDVVRRYRRTVKNLIFLAVLGTIWGLFQLLAMGACLQALVIPLYVTLGILGYVARDYFSVLTPEEQRKQASRTADRGRYKGLIVDEQNKPTSR